MLNCHLHGCNVLTASSGEDHCLVSQDGMEDPIMVGEGLGTDVYMETGYENNFCEQKIKFQSCF